ncbi:hypothetical protein BJV74DRAFT_944028 [Russula compacta]|nr:hypothetical protein BJV74DRAFT_944028 [Russula compacta]
MPHKRAKRSVREHQRKERGADLAPPGRNNPTGISTERVPKSAARVLDAERIRTEYRRKRAQLRTEETDAIDDTSASKPPPRKKRRTTIATTATATDTGVVLVEEEKGKGKSKVLSLANKGKGKDRPIGPVEIEIQPGESLKHFNRRVEDCMRPLVRSAMLASAATERKERKKAVATTTSATTTTTTHGNKLKAHAEDPPSTKTVHSRNDNEDDDNRPKEFATISSAAPRRLNDIAMAPPELKKLPRGAAKHSPGGKTTPAGAGVLSMAQRAMMEVERENAIRRYREMRERKAKESDRILLHGERHVDGG